MKRARAETSEEPAKKRAKTTGPTVPLPQFKSAFTKELKPELATVLELASYRITNDNKLLNARFFCTSTNVENNTTQEQIEVYWLEDIATALQTGQRSFSKAAIIYEKDPFMQEATAIKVSATNVEMDCKHVESFKYDDDMHCNYFFYNSFLDFFYWNLNCLVAFTFVKCHNRNGSPKA